MAPQPSPKECLPFYGHTKPNGFLSNFHRCSFVLADTVDEYTYSSAEQAIHHKKALLMGDAETAAKILLSDKPLVAKRLGRKAQPWDEEKWVQCRRRVAEEVLQAKFTQNDAIGKRLKCTGPLHLVEASPRDKIWGVGISVTAVQKGEVWKGCNILSEALMSVREKL